MSASHHVNPQQLKLFYDAQDLMNMRAGDSDWDLYEPLSEDNYPSTLANSPDLVQMKDEESDHLEHFDDDTDKMVGESLRESITNEGIRHPVSISFLATGEPILMNGHHRTVVAHQINPNMYVPTKLIEPSDSVYHRLASQPVDPSFDPRKKK